MAKGDDAVTRKKNKARRKKNQQNEKSSVSARVASIIAAKKRRLSGKRRKCQGMCFGLPTPDDPFNDSYGKSDLKVENKKKVAKKVSGPGREKHGKNIAEAGNLREKNEKVGLLQLEVEKLPISDDQVVRQKSDFDAASTKFSLKGKEIVCHIRERTNSISDNISKFLLLCIDTIEKGLHPEVTSVIEHECPLFANPWGVEFLRCYLMGQDILDTSGSSCTDEQIAWTVSVAADALARKEKKGLPFTNPFLLFIVPSHEKAVQVRHVCKSLKALGIHTVSVHPLASLYHQIIGLKSCEPEFLVSTPERLLELVSLKAIDISGVSFLVIDGLESFHKDGCLNALESIRQAISGNPFTIVFNDFFSHASTPTLQNVLTGTINRLSVNDSLPSQSACITQKIDVCTSKEVMISKSSKVLYIVGKENISHDIVNAINKWSSTDCKTSDSGNRSTANGKLETSISMINVKDMDTADVSIYESVILPNFVLSIEDYVNILTRMARYTTKGILHSFLTEEDAALAGPLIQVLEQCGQLVPEALRDLHLRSSEMESE